METVLSVYVGLFRSIVRANHGLSGGLPLSAERPSIQAERRYFYSLYYACYCDYCFREQRTSHCFYFFLFAKRFKTIIRFRTLYARHGRLHRLWYTGRNTIIIGERDRQSVTAIACPTRIRKQRRNVNT